MEKLYVIVRGDLPPGAQVAQSCHAMRLFSAQHPEVDREWYEQSNNLVCLQVADEDALLELFERAQSAEVATSTFREPDFGGSATAVAIGPAGKRLVSNLSLALRAAA